MKKLLVLFVFLFSLIFAHHVFAQNWQLQNSNFPSNVYVINFSPVNYFVCWAGGSGAGQTPYPGYIRTINSGNTWVCDSIPSIPDGLISQIFAIDADTAYIVVYVLASSNSKGIYKTTDGGTTWTKQNAYSSAFYGPGYIHFFDANNGVVIGDPNLETYTTTNGGLTWNPVTMPPILADEYTWVGGTGIAGHGNSVWFASTKRIFRSIDRGNTWTVSIAEPQYAFWGPCLAFQDESSGIYSLGNYSTQAHVYRKTTDGGITWNLISNTILDNLFPTCIRYIPGTTATYLVSGGSDVGMRGLAATLDTGENWTLVDTTGCYTIGFSSVESGWGDPYPSWQVHKYVGPAVPVELNTFTAKANGTEVTLNWSTATELNNYGFEIQRKVLSSDFAAIAFVKGQGTSTQKNEYSFVDKNLEEGKYSYRLKQVDMDGKFEYSKIVEVEVVSVTSYSLEQNYPNPFNPSTTINYALKEKCDVKLTLLNSIGEEIAVVVKGEQDKGYHKVEIDGSKLSSGVYFYKLVAGNFINTKKMILMK